MARPTRLAGRLAIIAGLTLALGACAGDTGDSAGLPTADDLGAEQADGGTGSPTTAGMCVEDEPDCQDMIAPGEGEAPPDAAGSCLAGDEDCTDESYGGQDVTRPVPLTDSASDASPIGSGATSGATGRPIVAAHLVDDTTLELTFEGGACDVLEDVRVMASPTEVRLLVLSGMDATVDACTQQVVEWSTEVRLEEALGDRALLDLAG